MRRVKKTKAGQQDHATAYIRFKDEELKDLLEEERN